MEKTKIHKKRPELAHLKKWRPMTRQRAKKKFQCKFLGEIFYLFKVSKGDKLFVGSFGRNCHERWQLQKQKQVLPSHTYLPTYLPTYVVCGPIVDSFGSNGVGKTCLIKVCSRTSDDNRVTKILFTFQLNWSSWWSNFLSRIFLFYVVTHVGIEKHSSATHGLLFAKLKSKCNVNALLKKAMYFLKMDQPRPLFA